MLLKRLAAATTFLVLANSFPTEVTAEEFSATSAYVRKAPSSATAREHLQRIMSSSGSARLIVGVSLPKTTVKSTSDSEATEQPQTISRVQDAVLARLHGAFGIDSVQKTSPRRARSFPYLVVTANAPQLEHLLSDPDVSSIQVSGSSTLSLDNSVTLIDARPLWSRGFKGGSYSVAVLDSGIDPRHPMFAGRIKTAAEACFSSTNGIYTSQCANGGPFQLGPQSATTTCKQVACSHGTAMASIVAGRQTRTGGRTLSGVMRGASSISAVNPGIVPIKTTSVRSTGGLRVQDEDLLLALDWAYGVKKLYRIASVLLALNDSGRRFSGNCDENFPAFGDAIEAFRRADIPVVVSSGNNGSTSTVAFPACLRGSIAVAAALDPELGTLDTDSNLAPLVRFRAPGGRSTGIGSGSVTTATILGSGTAKGDYSQRGGSSVAAAHVAGALGLLKNAIPGADLASVVRALECTGLGIPNVAQSSGNSVHRPYIRAFRALDWLRGTSNATPSRNWNLSQTSSPDNKDWSSARGEWTLDQFKGAVHMGVAGSPTLGTWAAFTTEHCMDNFDLTIEFDALPADTPPVGGCLSTEFGPICVDGGIFIGDLDENGRKINGLGFFVDHRIQGSTVTHNWHVFELANFVLGRGRNLIPQFYCNTTNLPAKQAGMPWTVVVTRRNPGWYTFRVSADGGSTFTPLCQGIGPPIRSHYRIGVLHPAQVGRSVEMRSARIKHNTFGP